jgi:hypothetical protein
MNPTYLGNFIGFMVSQNIKSMSYFEDKLIMVNLYVAFDMEKNNFYKLWGFNKCL